MEIWKKEHKPLDEYFHSFFKFSKSILKLW